MTILHIVFAAASILDVRLLKRLRFSQTEPRFVGSCSSVLLSMQRECSPLDAVVLGMQDMHWTSLLLLVGYVKLHSSCSDSSPIQLLVVSFVREVASSVFWSWLRCLLSPFVTCEHSSND